MKIVLAGGHLSPAISVLQALPKDAKVLFIGRKYTFEGDRAVSLEYSTIANLKIPFASITAGRLQRKLTSHTFSSLLKVPIGIIQSFFILFKFKPDVVLGFGGYVSIPVAISAFLLRIPVVIHEQTLEAGFANRFLAKFAAKVCVSWQSSSKFFPKGKTILTGNPIRSFKAISDKRKAISEKILPVIYVTGGSSGSHFINTLIEECLKKLLEKYIVIHQTGDAMEYGDFDRLAKVRESLSLELRERYEIKKFIDPRLVGSILTNANLVVGRSGINTITELIHFQKPALLIPLPFSQNDEQLKNAKFLEKIGLGKVLKQSEVDSKKLFQAIDLMLSNIKNYKINFQNDKGDPEQNIIDVINYVYRSEKAKIF